MAHTSLISGKSVLTFSIYLQNISMYLVPKKDLELKIIAIKVKNYCGFKIKNEVYFTMPPYIIRQKIICIYSFVILFPSV